MHIKHCLANFYVRRMPRFQSPTLMLIIPFLTKGSYYLPRLLWANPGLTKLPTVPLRVYYSKSPAYSTFSINYTVEKANINERKTVYFVKYYLRGAHFTRSSKANAIFCPRRHWL
jgi:hypothetical protein